MRRLGKKFIQEHPVVLIIYLFGGMLITMLTMHPVLLAISIGISGFYAGVLCGKKLWIQLLWVMLPVLFFTVIILPLFSHNGITPLFYINDMPVTKESVSFGLVMSELLLGIFLWFRVANAIMDSEKILYLFGRTFPVVGLLVSMVFRLIPQMRLRFYQIQDAQKGMGRAISNLSIHGKIRMLLKEMSILISWSLESSIETSISMESRGYGTGKRTSFDLFRFTSKSAVWCVLFLGLYGIVIVILARGGFQVSYFPAVHIQGLTKEITIGCIAFGLAGILPVLE